MPDADVPPGTPSVARGASEGTGTRGAVNAPSTSSPSKTAAQHSDKMICERCGTSEMYRMHAVWRCPSCGFKTDCCGW
jgi:ribosomal protein L37AE/L43A